MAYDLSLADELFGIGNIDPRAADAVGIVRARWSVSTFLMGGR